MFADHDGDTIRIIYHSNTINSTIWLFDIAMENHHL